MIIGLDLDFMDVYCCLYFKDEDDIIDSEDYDSDDLESLVKHQKFDI